MPIVDVTSKLRIIARRVKSLQTQREEVARDLRRVLQHAQQMLSSLEGTTSASPRVARLKNKGGRPKGYTMSEATKAKLRAAWARRKAKAGKPRKTMSPEARAKISAALRKRWAQRKNR